MSADRTVYADFTHTCRDCGATITVRDGKTQPHDHVRPTIVIRNDDMEATCLCNPAEVENGTCIICGKPYLVGGSV